MSTSAIIKGLDEPAPTKFAKAYARIIDTLLTLY